MKRKRKPNSQHLGTHIEQETMSHGVTAGGAPTVNPEPPVDVPNTNEQVARATTQHSLASSVYKEQLAGNHLTDEERTKLSDVHAMQWKSEEYWQPWTHLIADVVEVLDNYNYEWIAAALTADRLAPSVGICSDLKARWHDIIFTAMTTCTTRSTLTTEEADAKLAFRYPEMIGDIGRLLADAELSVYAWWSHPDVDSGIRVSLILRAAHRVKLIQNQLTELEGTGKDYFIHLRKVHADTVFTDNITKYQELLIDSEIFS